RHRLHASLDCFSDAAALLDAQDRRRPALPVELHQAQPLALNQVLGLAGFAAQTDEAVGGDVWVPGEAGQAGGELAVVRAVVLHGAALLVADRHHAVHVREVAQQAALADALGDVLAGVGRAIDGADDRDVVARAVAAVAAVVAVEVTNLLGRWR